MPGGVFSIKPGDGVSNIWRQMLDGSPPAQITFFETGRIANFAYSPDYKHLALSRWNFASDVFLLKNKVNQKNPPKKPAFDGLEFSSNRQELFTAKKNKFDLRLNSVKIKSET